MDNYWRTEAMVIFVHINKTAGTSVARALGQPLTAHPTAEEIRDRIGRRVYESKPSFAVVRNPFDRFVSLFEFRRRRGLIPDGISFDHWTRETIVERNPIWMGNSRWFMPQICWVTAAADRGTLIVNEIARFESLNTDFARIVCPLGITTQLPVLNSSSGRGRYRDYYTSETREMVTGYYAQDLDTWDYEF